MTPVITDAANFHDMQVVTYLKYTRNQQKYLHWIQRIFNCLNHVWGSENTSQRKSGEVHKHKIVEFFFFDIGLFKKPILEICL